jgi:primosomal protein N'
LKGRHRRHLLVKLPDPARLDDLLVRLLGFNARNPRVRATIDVDPVSML